MKISIITITYNSQATVEDTLKSVLEQDYPDIEYIIVDGRSKDQTLKIVNRYSDRISKIVSEKDNGLYDALNKGISLATGEVIGMLHSDDVYAYPQAISDVMKQFKSDSALEGVYADLVFVNRQDPNKVMRYWKSGEYIEGSFEQGWMPPHPTFFVRKDCYAKHGSFNTSLKLSADYELMLRLIHIQKIKIKYLPSTLVKMKMGGTSNVSFFVKLKANIEDKLAWKMNGVKPGFLTFFKKPLRKLSQYFKRTVQSLLNF
ncbi:MAG TPA: glycosyltransferase family 2 protein [Bacteroidia bacterium]|nr:glycosyltransferase family 2 protein [Bacteroidia bacterium]HNT79085.1 glycosyltransferase family 2 protein [Bacteroidia bacterium]